MSTCHFLGCFVRYCNALTLQSCYGSHLLKRNREPRISLYVFLNTARLRDSKAMLPTFSKSSSSNNMAYMLVISRRWPLHMMV